MKVSELMKLTEREIKSLSEADLRSAFSNVKRSMATRKTYFEKAGVKQNLPKIYREAVESSKDLTAGQLAKVLGATSAYFRGTLSTAKGMSAYQHERREGIKKRIGAEDLSDSQFDQYGKFMGEMQNRYKEAWKEISHDAKKIALEAARKNLSMDQFKMNFDYWLEHDQDYEEMILERQDSEDSDLIDDWYSSEPEKTVVPEKNRRQTQRRSGRMPKARQQRSGRKRR